jgi:hypothetical protein
MGRYISPFGLNIDGINALFGCKNKAKLTAIKKARTFFDYEELTGTRASISVFDAVQDFLFAKKHDAPEAVYYTALLLMCDALKVPLPQPQRIQLGEQSDIINRYLVSDFGAPETQKIEQLMFDVDATHIFKKPLVLPATFARFSDTDHVACLNLPMIGIWTHAQVEAMGRMFASAAITDAEIKTLGKSKSQESKLKSIAYRDIQEFASNIVFCAFRGLGMIFFSY